MLDDLRNFAASGIEIQALVQLAVLGFQASLPGGTLDVGAVRDVLVTWYNVGVKGALIAAATDPSRVDPALRELLVWWNEVQRFGAEVAGRLSLQVAESQGLLTTAMRNSVRSLDQQCRAQRDITLRSQALRRARQADLLGLATEDNGLLPPEVELAFCAEVVIEKADLPDPLEEGKSGVLEVTAGVSYASATPVHTVPLRVTVTPSGTTDNSTSSHQPDRAGTIRRSLIAAAGARSVEAHIRACMTSDEFPALNQLCAERQIARNVKPGGVVYSGYLTWAFSYGTACGTHVERRPMTITVRSTTPQRYVIDAVWQPYPNYTYTYGSLALTWRSRACKVDGVPHDYQVSIIGSR